LSSVRDLLLPGLRMERAAGRTLGDQRLWNAEADIQIDNANDRLLMKVIDVEHKRSVVGIILRSDIESREYLRKWRPLLQTMADHILSETTEETFEVAMSDVKEWR
jgi:hypothetical protein